MSRNQLAHVPSLLKVLLDGVVAHQQLVEGKRLARVEPPNNLGQRHVVIKHVYKCCQACISKSSPGLSKQIQLANRAVLSHQQRQCRCSFVVNLVLFQIQQQNSVVFHQPLHQGLSIHLVQIHRLEMHFLDHCVAGQRLPKLLSKLAMLDRKHCVRRKIYHLQRRIIRSHSSNHVSRVVLAVCPDSRPRAPQRATSAVAAGFANV